MKAKVVISFRESGETPVYIVVAGVSLIKKGKRTGGAFHFLIPAVYDVRENGYRPNSSETILCMDDDKYYDSILQFVSKKYGVQYKQTKVLKIKDINLE